MSLARSDHDLRVEAGFASETGKRPDNQDYVAVCFGPRGGALQGVVGAVADGVGGHKGGRVAAEICVRAFIEGYYASPETLGVGRAAARALDAANRWIAAQARVDPALEGMATTFSALILSRRAAHILHVGDTRVYRLGAGGFELLTRDHVLGGGDLRHVLRRAVGLEDALPFDQACCAVAPHDRFLLCSDGVHGALRDVELRAFMAERRSPQETAERIVEAALAAGDGDNATALVIDIVDLPSADESALARVFESLPIREPPKIGESVDGFTIEERLSDGRYSILMRARDEATGAALALKFPHPRIAQDSSYRLAFVREAWASARVRSPFVGEIVELPAGRQSRLYSVMPFYAGETLEQRMRRAKVGLDEGLSIALRLARGLAALHRCGIIHRDVKPDNVILLEDGGLRLVDLGVCRAPNLEDFSPQDAPGTPSYMAPELFAGAAGDEASDLYALGVAIYRMFCGAYPHGEIEPFTRPRFGRPKPLSARRPDLPAWLDAALRRAVAVDPRERHGDVLEFAFELENGAVRTPPSPRLAPLYARNPLLFWQGLSLALVVLLAISLYRR
ncbi:bifunctional protein-serine/threonine kinase/phosphatase [Methylosinus sp. Sm6]|uniref:bifunctional protein-serine/threonine kinase/phosphatase n=1 Tax=Methylosinus sp. Sm6 TaxID=2866948 RepID=UPI001C99BD35|nr:bifunctional protein-serine/threonine kinase/phosphatase [Methylosinus sp. Sm6]MBY6242312.1 protein kinase [Methylosinus sp. Sm6]